MNITKKIANRTKTSCCIFSRTLAALADGINDPISKTNAFTSISRFCPKRASARTVVSMIMTEKYCTLSDKFVKLSKEEKIDVRSTHMMQMMVEMMAP